MLTPDPILIIRDYSFAYPGNETYLLKNISLQIKPGECHCITGPTGSGKSTLLLLIKKLLTCGRQKGEILLPSPSVKCNSKVGIILQNPETQLLCPTIGSEIAFGLENRCIDPVIMPELIEEAASSIGLDMPLGTNSSNLSMGQKYRLLLAAFLAMTSELLLLDEPCAQLDQAGIEKLAQIIAELKKKGKSFLICEHNAENLKSVIDFYWKLDKRGRLHPASKSSTFLYSKDRPLIKDNIQESKQEVIAVKNLTITNEDKEPILSDISFSINKGMNVAVCGSNGAGKTTLFRALAGFLPPSAGQVRVLGIFPHPEKLRGKIGYLFQNPQKQLFEDTVLQETAFTLKRLKLSTKLIESSVEKILTLLNISDLSYKSPHKLSFGQQHLVALASVLVYKPEILLLDDPFAGLDKEYQELIRQALVTINEENQTTIIWTTHHSDLETNWANMSLQLEKGTLVEKYPVAA